MLILAYRETGFALQRATWALILALLASGGLTLWGMQADSVVGFVAGVVVATVVSAAALVSLFRLRAKERQEEKDAELLV